MTASRDDADDRRAIERRWQDRIESRLGVAEERLGRTEVKLDMLVLTVNSRHEALEGGQKELAQKVDALEAVKDRLLGAYALVMFLGVSGLVGMVIAIVKLAKAP